MSERWSNNMRPIRSANTYENGNSIASNLASGLPYTLGGVLRFIIIGFGLLAMPYTSAIYIDRSIHYTRNTRM